MPEDDSRWAHSVNIQFFPLLSPGIQGLDIVLGHLMHGSWILRLRSDLVPEHGARTILDGTNVNTRFFKYPRQNSCTVPVPEYKVSTLYSGTELGTDSLGTQCLNTVPFCAGARTLVLGHQV